ncbi:alpha/beta fold hydrolase [Candidatus Saccharibacteria bacterium]|nr:alpha/beta fold hydrolase [Candidatus Saccharibacteria bacterium]
MAKEAAITLPTSTSEDVQTLRDNKGLLISGHDHVSGVDVTFTERVPDGTDPELGTVVIVPGYYGLKWTYGDFRDELASLLHRRVRTYRHGRVECSPRLLLHPDALLHPDKLGKKSASRMIRSAHTMNPVAPVTVLGHSMGGPHAVDATLRKIDMVDATILFGSAGLEEGQNTFRLARRLPSVIKNEIIPGALELAQKREGRGQVIGEAIMHGLAHPWRLGGEALDVSNRPFMEPELVLLNRADIDVYVIHLEDDGFFPPERSGLRAAGRLATRVDTVPNADHILPQLEPQRAAEAVRDVLQPANYISGVAA